MKKYDLQIILPLTATGRWKRRISDFQKYGLYNIKERKILITALIGPENPEEFKNGWPSQIDLELIPGSSTQPGTKVYEYFSKMTSEKAAESKWIAKIDDDSYNDIDGLLSDFEADFNEKDRLYLVGKIQEDMENTELSLIRGMELPTRYFFHEHEGCFLSSVALQEILSNKLCKELFKARSKMAGFTDQCLALAAKLCKIHPIRARNLLSNLSGTNKFIEGCSVFGGVLTHYHPISNDRSKQLNEWLLWRTCGITEENYPLIDKIIDSKFVVTAINRNSIISIKKYGEISQNSLGLRGWQCVGNRILFCNNDGSTILAFDYLEQEDIFIDSNKNPTIRLERFA